MNLISAGRPFYPTLPALFMQLGEPENDVVLDVNWRTLITDVNVNKDEPSLVEGQSTE